MLVLVPSVKRYLAKGKLLHLPYMFLLCFFVSSICISVIWYSNILHSFFSENSEDDSTKFPYLWVIGSVGIAVFMIGIALLLCISFKSCNFWSPNSHRKCPDQPISHKFQILKSSSICYASRRFLCFKSENFKHSTQDSGDHLVNNSNGSGSPYSA